MDPVLFARRVSLSEQYHPRMAGVRIRNQPLIGLSRLADGRMVAWSSPGTRLPQGFVTLRLRTNTLKCCAVEEFRTDGRYTTEPVQLLCRVLRLAAESYRTFEIRPAEPDVLLHVEADVSLFVDEDTEIQRCHSTKSSYTFGELAAAMKRCGAAEGLIVVSLPDQGITVRRADTTEDQPAAARVHQVA